MDFTIKIKNFDLYYKKIDNLFNNITCNVQTNYMFYNIKTKQIIKIGSSRPCGINKYHTSIHAEIIAIKNYNLLNKKKNIIIIIWKFTKDRKIKQMFCCLNCTKYLKRYNYENLIYTINDNKLVSAIINNPEICFGFKLKYNKI